MRLAFLLLWMSTAVRRVLAAECEDSTGDCGPWAKAGECTNNPGYMHASCRMSCGLCEEKQKAAPKQKSASAKESTTAKESTSRGSRTGHNGARANSAESILGGGVYTLHAGRFGGAGGEIKKGMFDLEGAREWCDQHKSCQGFAMTVNKPAALPSGTQRVSFRTMGGSIVDDVGSVAFVRTSAKGQGQCSGSDGDNCAPTDPAAQVAAYYLRAAELLAEGGSQHAQDVIDQVRAALLSGADKDACYLLRARAYIHQENLASAKRDVGAILRSDPDHTKAKALHRKLKKFQKALDEGSRLLSSREWAAAADKFVSAKEAFDPPVLAAAMRSGLCQSYMKLKKAPDAVLWCERAQKAEPDDLSAIFQLSDAKVLNGEEHAGLQLLKAAQRRFRHPQLQQKVQNLERKIKNASKVNHYKVLGVSRTANSREIKKAYHQLAKRYHPDKVSGDEDEKKAAEAIFKKVARAYEVIGDDDLRRRYDAGEDVDDPNAMNQQQQQHGGFHGGFPGGFPGGFGQHRGQRMHFRR